MKKIGVIGIKDGWSTMALADAVENVSGFRLVVDMNEIRCDLESGSLFAGKIDLTTLDALIIKKIGPAYSPDLLDRLELLRLPLAKGVQIFSSPEKILRVLDRLSCTMTLSLGNIPMPPTTITESIDEAVMTVENYGRSVFKPLFSTKARGMALIESGKRAREDIQQFQANGNPVMYIQKWSHLPGRDLGIVFLGGKYLATYARVKTNDSWSTTTSMGGRYEPCEPSDHLIELADRAQSLFGLDFTCVDVAESENGPIVFEVSAFGGFRGLLEANHIDAAKCYTDYVYESIK